MSKAGRRQDEVCAQAVAPLPGPLPAPEESAAAVRSSGAWRPAGTRPAAALVVVNTKNVFDFSKQCVFEDSAHLTREAALSMFPSDFCGGFQTGVGTSNTVVCPGCALRWGLAVGGWRWSPLRADSAASSAGHTPVLHP